MQALEYDTLPAHSRLRREFADGVLKITAAAETPGPLVRRAALFRSALPAAMICFATLVIGFAVFGSMYMTNRALMPWPLSFSLFGAFVVLCMSLFAFVWRIQYSVRLEAAERALKQNTILAASVGRLLIETNGPFGAASHDLAAVHGIRRGSTSDARPVSCLEIVLTNGSSIRVLPGRDEAELRWVALALTQTLRG
jgi:hypothetical protein